MWLIRQRRQSEDYVTEGYLRLGIPLEFKGSGEQEVKRDQQLIDGGYRVIKYYE